MWEWQRYCLYHMIYVGGLRYTKVNYDWHEIEHKHIIKFCNKWQAASFIVCFVKGTVKVDFLVWVYHVIYFSFDYYGIWRFNTKSV